MSAGSPQTRAAALIRADIRRAAEDGTLGELPDGISFSVRANDLRATPGVTITVYRRAPGWADTGEYAALREKLTEIAARHWQPAGQGFTDVRLVGGTVMDAELTDAERQIIGLPSARGPIPGHPRRKD
jgi:hypothetical protein